MDNELTGLLEQIRREGIDKAKQEADKILADAQARARGIVKEAEDQAAKTLQQARLDIQRLQQSSEAALVQAGRDLLLSLQKRLSSLLDALLKDAVQEALSPELTEKLILEAVRNWKPESAQIQVPAADLARLENALKQRLREHVSQGVDLVPSPHLSRGFRLGTRDGSLFYDFTPAVIAEVLSESVAPHLATLLKKAVE